MYLPRFREFATLVMIATLYSPLAGSGQAWCDAWDCESPDATQEADLWDAFGLIYVHPEFQVCQEIYDAADEGLGAVDVWVADLPGDTAGVFAEGQEPSILIDSSAFTSVPFDELTRIFVHEVCESLGYGDTACNTYDDVCRTYSCPEPYQLPVPTITLGRVLGPPAAVPEGPSDAPTLGAETIDGGPYVAGPYLSEVSTIATRGRRAVLRGGLFSRDSDSTKILAAVVRGLTQGWDEDQVIVRARPRMAPFVRPVAEAVRASDNDCALLECVRSGRVVIELAALSVDGQGSVVHLGRVTLGPENQSHVELFKVTLSRTNRSGDWTIDQIERLAVG